VAHQDYRSFDLPDHLAGPFSILGQRGQRVFHRAQRPEAAAPQLGDDLGPVGSSTPEAMDQDNCGLVRHESSFG
jgi:hypothetical protein